MCTRNRWLAAVALLLVLTLAGIACRQESSARGRVLLIGIDGAAPRLIEPWMQDGLLPNLARLAREGASGSLRSHFPLLSPRIWTSMATGKRPEGHGIENWVIPMAQGKLRLYRGSDRKGPALWNILSEAGYTVGVVNWLMTYPPEKINGCVISDFAIPGERKGRQDFADTFLLNFGPVSIERRGAERDIITAFPIHWIERVADLARKGPRLERVPDPRVPFENQPVMRKILSKAYLTDDLAMRIAFEVDRLLEPDLLMVLLPGIDRISHRFWGGVEPPEIYPEETRPTPRQRIQWFNALRSYYEYTDALIGDLAARFSRKDLILVVSDHGFEARTDKRGKSGTHVSKAAQDGAVFARGPGVAKGKRIEGMSVNDVTPTILAWFALPVAADMDGRPAAFLDLPRIERVASYDGTAVERVDTTADELEQGVIKDLRALGYIE